LLNVAVSVEPDLGAHTAVHTPLLPSINFEGRLLT
jgi:hypothetical protein